MASMKQTLSHNLTRQLRLIHILPLQATGIAKANAVTARLLAAGEAGDLRRAHTMNLNKIWMFGISPFFMYVKWRTAMNLLRGCGIILHEAQEENMIYLDKKSLHNRS